VTEKDFALADEIERAFAAHPGWPSAVCSQPKVHPGHEINVCGGRSTGRPCRRRRSRG
jgi:hypothetical protein